MPAVVIETPAGVLTDAKKRTVGKVTGNATTRSGQLKPRDRTTNRPRIVARAITPKRWGLAGFVAVILLATAVMSGSAQFEADYPPLGEYLMPRDAEIALAKSAAPPNVSDRATIKVFTESGFRVASEGDNGFVCMVLRGWAAPTYTPAPLRDLVYYAKVRSPICFDPVAARTVMPYQELRHTLGMAGKDPDQIADGVEAAYATGELPSMEAVAFAYMWSADMDLGPGIGAFHPHMMVYSPHYENAMLGGNEFGGELPFVSDDAGTPFTVTVIPVDQALAIKAGAVSDEGDARAATGSTATQ